MAVPVQTWGSMGQFVAEQREFGTQCSGYLEKNEIYDLFSTLLRQITVEQPDDPIAFLKQQLADQPPLAVCIMGPPGVDRRAYCKKVADEFSLVHVSSGMLLEEGIKKGQLGKEVEDAFKSGQLVGDDVVIPLVMAAIEKAKKTVSSTQSSKGYVLEGFPRTKVQAATLSTKQVGFGVDNMLLLMAPDAVIKSGYAAKLGQNDDLLNQRLQQYHRHVISIADMFKNVIRRVPIDLKLESIENMEMIKSSIHMRPSAVAPLRSHRVCIVGPCCSGRTTQAKAIASRYGLVHVDLPVLIKGLQEDRGQMVQDMPPEYMSDEDLCMIVGRRLNETDCIRKGWVLDGFPTTQAQAEFLRQAHLWPTRLMELQVSEGEVKSRIETRRVDPVTCTIYYEPPASVAIRQRLVQLDHDLPVTVKERWDTSVTNIAGAKATFGTVTSTVVGNAQKDAITKNMQRMIETLLPHEA